MYDRFDAFTFVAYLKETQRYFGKILMVTDLASSHSSDLVKEFLHDNKNIKMVIEATKKQLPNDAYN